MIKWLERLIYGELPPAHKVAEQEAKEKELALKQAKPPVKYYDARQDMYVRPKKARTERNVVRKEFDSRKRRQKDDDVGVDYYSVPAAIVVDSYTPPSYSSSRSDSCSSSSSSSSSDSSSSSSSSDSGSSSSGGCD